MKRREFSLSAASAVAASALALPVATPALAQARQFKEGKDYKRLDKPVAPDAPAGKVDVTIDHWRNFLQCARTREKPVSDVQFGLHVQAALNMAMLGYLKEKVMRFDPEKKEIVAA